MNPVTARLLAPLGHVYGAAMRARRSLYAHGLLPRRRLAVPVVSIGNLSLGGTGKTPFASWLASGLRDRGLRVAILLRGYGRETAGVRVVSDGQTTTGDARSVGDEAVMLARDLPGVGVVVGASRFRAGVTAVRELGSEVVILDDGFQHLALHRDLEIVLVDGLRSPAAERMLPAGRLRERPESLAVADVIAVTRSHLTAGGGEVMDWIAALAPHASLLAVETRPRRLIDRDGAIHAVDFLRAKTVVALSAIGAPAQAAADIGTMAVHRFGERTLHVHLQHEMHAAAQIQP